VIATQGGVTGAIFDLENFDGKVGYFHDAPFSMSA